MSEKKRIEWLDSIKGFAIIMVVLGHIMHGYLTAGLYQDNTNIMLVLDNFAYAFHMPLFFVLSGFSFGFAYVDGTEHYTLKSERIKVQLANITVLYFMWSIIQWVVKMFMSKYVNSEYTLADLLWMPLKAVAPYWYLYVLAICYLLTCLIVAKKIKWEYVFIISFVVCLLFGWIRKLGNLTIITTSGYYFFFLLGLTLSKRQNMLEMLKKYQNIFIMLIAGIVIGLTFTLTKDEQIGWSDVPIAGSIMALTFSLAFIGVAQRFPIPIFEIAGRYSLEIFLTHCFITAANRKILPAIGIHIFGLNIITNLLMATIFPILFSLALKRIGLHKLFFKPCALLKKKS